MFGKGKGKGFLGSAFAEAQKRLDELNKNQSLINQMLFEAESDCGKVKVVAGGDMRLRSIVVDPSFHLAHAEEEGKLSEVLIETINSSLSKAQKRLQETNMKTMAPILEGLDK